MAELSSGGPFEGRFKMVVINWVANPFRGDRLEEAWRPAAEAALDYGATAWAFTRSTDDPLSFMQVALFQKKIDFDRYWLSEEIAAARVAIGGLYQVPLLPIWYEAVGVGMVTDDIQALESPNGNEEAA
jgi:hypothetical protein